MLLCMFPFSQNKGKQLQKQQDIIYGLIRSGERITELEEYFDIYLSLMGKYAGDIDTQLLIATIFAKYANSFTASETGNLSRDQIADIRATAQRMLLGCRDGRRYSSSN